MTTDPISLLRRMFDAAVSRAMPDKCLPPFLPHPPTGRTIVVGAGKAAATMAKTVEDHWHGELSGRVVTRYGHRVPTKRIEVVEAAHPVPDLAGREAAERILTRVQGLSRDDLVLCLISGGGSALLTLPAPGLTLQDKQAINRALLKSGANIAEMNCVRKHLSAIKGGRLAAACYPAQVVTLTISDVPGDDPAVIASGPTVPDRTTFADALDVLAKYNITEPVSVIDHLRAAREETPKPGDPRLAGTQVHLIATPQQSLEAAAEVARHAGITPLILGDSLEGESRDVALALALGGEPGVFALAGDTDGVDGTEDNAGAMVTPDTLQRAAARGLDAKAHLADNDGYTFFSGLGDLVKTGPTLTNVNDFRAILILPAA